MTKKTVISRPPTIKLADPLLVMSEKRLDTNLYLLDI